MKNLRRLGLLSILGCVFIAIMENNIKVNAIDTAVLINNENSISVKEESNILKTVKLKTDTYVFSGIHFNEYDLRVVSNITEEELSSVLSGTGLHHLTPYYIESEKTFGVNALFLVGITALESSWGTSDRAVYDNNYTGYGVYEDSSEGINSDTARGNILGTAECISKEYLSENGKYFNGYSLEDINIRYSLDKEGNPNPVWGNVVSEIAYDFYNELLDIRKSNYNEIYSEFLNNSI